MNRTLPLTVTTARLTNDCLNCQSDIYEVQDDNNCVEHLISEIIRKSYMNHILLIILIKENSLV